MHYKKLLSNSLFRDYFDWLWEIWKRSSFLPPICEHGFPALIIQHGHLRFHIQHLVMLPDYLLPLILALRPVTFHPLVKLPISVFLFLYILFDLSEPFIPVIRLQPLLKFLSLHAVKLLYCLQSDLQLINLCQDDLRLVLYTDSIHLLAALCCLIAWLDAAELLIPWLETID